MTVYEALALVVSSIVAYTAILSFITYLIIELIKLLRK